MHSRGRLHTKDVNMHVGKVMNNIIKCEGQGGGGGGGHKCGKLNPVGRGF